MTTFGTTTGTTTGSPSTWAMLAPLARKEARRYARHPLFLVGALLTLGTTAMPPDTYASSLMNVIVPAAGLGVFGLVVMVSLVRSSDQTHRAGGAVAVGERMRTLALACATVVPLTVALVWFGWAVWAYHHWPAPPNGAPFGAIGDGWSYAVLFALGVLPAVGGPVLGLLIGRYVRLRGAAPTAAVLLVLATIMMQGLFEPLRYVRVVMPWTYFTGPYGVDGDPNRFLILTGSPQWYGGYLLALCVLGVLVAMRHDREAPRRRLDLLIAAAVVTAVVLCLLAMTTGVQHVMVNPLPGPEL